MLQNLPVSVVLGNMYHVLYLLTLTGFFLLPPVLLMIRFFHPDKVSWWLVLLTIPIGCWLLVNATVVFYYEYLGALIENHPNPPQELMDRWAADGAKRVFALLFGWLYGFIYSVPFLFIYGVAHFFRRRKRGNG